MGRRSYPPKFRRKVQRIYSRSPRTLCGLTGVICGSIRAVSDGDETAPQPAEDVGCSGSPEGRCASLRDGPAAHLSPDPLQPEESRLWEAIRSVDGRRAWATHVLIARAGVSEVGPMRRSTIRVSVSS